MVLTVVHPHVDLDACACVALTNTHPEAIAFLPANATQLPDNWRDARVLDHALGVKGACDADGRLHAAVLALPEAADLRDGDLLAEIDEQDAWGQVARPRFSLGAVLAALRQDFLSQGMDGECLDRRILETMTPILRALANVERRRNAVVTKPPCPVIQVGPWAFLMRDEARTDEEAGPGAARECAGAVYRDGYSLGVVRYPGRDQPDLRGLAPHLRGWFVHSAGFLACWGSRKAPAAGPPPAGTPQDLPALAALLQSVLKLQE